jgi:predicted nucleotidyltransferase
LGGPVALPSRYSRTAGPEFDKSPKKVFFFRTTKKTVFRSGRLYTISQYEYHYREADKLAVHIGFSPFWEASFLLGRRGSSSLPLSVITTYVVCFYRMLDFRSKARQRLLAYYFTNPTARHHLRDLAERLSLDPSNLSKELGRLERDGLFRSEISGRQKYFQLNRKYPLLNEMRKIVAKTIGAAPLIAQSLKRIEGIHAAYLYGSYANNQQDAASDIDVLVIGSPREEDLAQAMRALERKLGREINYTALSPKELGSRRARKDAFLENVWHNKRIPLVGSNEETKATHR